jgi:hypothetical protein
MESGSGRLHVSLVRLASTLVVSLDHGHDATHPREPPATPQGKVNVTDPDSRNVKTPRGWFRATTPK